MPVLILALLLYFCMIFKNHAIPLLPSSFYKLPQLHYYQAGVLWKFMLVTFSEDVKHNRLLSITDIWYLTLVI